MTSTVGVITICLSASAVPVAPPPFRGDPVAERDQPLIVDPAAAARVAADAGAFTRTRGIEVHRAGTTGSTDAPGFAIHELHTGLVSLEPTMGITPQGVVLADTNSSAGEGVVRTRDQGKTFENVTPMLGGTDAHSQTLDPYLYVDSRTGRVFLSDLVEPCQEIAYSDDAGTTWSETVTDCDQSDHQTIFAGPPATSTPSGYPNVVYDCAIAGGVATPVSTISSCDKSLDGGVTFAHTGAPAFVVDPAKATANGEPVGTCDGAVGHGAVGPDGTVLVPRGYCGQPWLAISHDEGLSWTTVQVASNGMNLSLYNVYDHEAGVAQDAAGNIYYTWVAHNRMPYLAVSRDRGKTWSAPLSIAPPGVREASLPSIAIDSHGALAFGYMGSTNSPGAPFPGEASCSPFVFLAQNCPDPPQYKSVTWNAYIAKTTNPLVAHPTLVTATVNDPAKPFIRGTCGPIRCKAVYDFIDVEIAPDGSVWGAYIDGCPGGKCAIPGELVFGRLAPDAAGAAARGGAVAAASTSMPNTGTGSSAPLMTMVALGLSVLVVRLAPAAAKGFTRQGR